METGRMEKIGNVVLDYTRYPGEDFYCDGASEDELLSVAKNTAPSRYPEVIREKCSWEVLYHLSDLRENIVEWLPMDKSMKVLEVGSGCGAITGSLARKAGSVTCVDLSRKRSLINAYRHKESGNVTIHVGNFQDIEPDLPADYDYVCLIGVFEYGQSYIGGDTPFHDFYRIIKKHVKAGGRIVIAIENKMGLKYWAGCREDHLGSFFSGLEDYPDGGAVRTFTKGGLEKILKECGEEEYHFYYPYPDYKFMTMVYSDRYLPKVGELSNNLRNFDRDRMLLFDEKKVFDMLIRENLFPLYSNSYLVVTGPAPETIYSRFSNDRAAHLSIRTDIVQEESGRKYVRKYPAGRQAQAHIHRLADNYRAFAERFAGSTLCVNRLKEKRTPEGNIYAELEFLERAVTLEELLDDCLQKGDEAGFFSLFERYLGLLSWNAEGKLQDFDLIFPNICVQGDTWTMIDYEWESAEIAPGELAQRAVYCYGLENEKRKESPIFKKLAERLGMDEQAVARIQKKESEFQRSVMREEDGSVRTAVTDLRHLIGNKAVPAKEYFAVAAAKRMQVFEDFGAGYSPEHSYYIDDANLTSGRIQAEIFCRPGVCGIRLDPAEEPCLVRIEEVSYGGRKLTGQQLARAVVTNGEALGSAGEGREGMASVLFDHSDPNINVRLDQLRAMDAEADSTGIGRKSGAVAGMTPGGAAGFGCQSGAAVGSAGPGGRNGAAKDRTPDSAAETGLLIIKARIAHLSPEMLADLKAQKASGRKHHWFQR